jgi:hypothetical protein
LDIIKKIKGIIQLKDEVERHLKTLSAIEWTLKYLYEKYMCEENDDCILLTDRLENWIRLYNYVREEKDLNDLIDHLKYSDFKVEIKLE